MIKYNFLCSSCNSKGKSKLKSSFQLTEIFTDTFIQNHTSFKSLEDFVDASQIKIEHQNDLNSQEWNDFVVNSSNFKSWIVMEKLAVNELSYNHRKEILENISKNT